MAFWNNPRDFATFDKDRGHDGDWINDEKGRPDGRAHAAMTHKSSVSDREWEAVQRQAKGR